MPTEHRLSIPALALALAVASASTGCERADTASASPAAAVEAHEQTIGELIRRLADATNRRDFEAFGSAITDDWSYFTSGGSEVDLAGFVEMISGWEELRIEVTDIRPWLSADERLAWATFRGELSGEAAGVAIERRLRFTAILHRAEAVWSLRHLQSTVASQRLR
jgi:ketosteroid isomerase-like protein